MIQYLWWKSNMGHNIGIDNNKYNDVTREVNKSSAVYQI